MACASQALQPILRQAAKRSEEFGNLLFAFAPLARQFKLDAHDAPCTPEIEFIRCFKAVVLGFEARYRQTEHAAFDEMYAFGQKGKDHEDQGF